MFDFLRNLRKSAEEKQQEQLHAYLDDALTPQEQQQFEREMAQDAALRAEVDDLRVMKQQLRDLPRRPVPRSFTLDPAVYGRPARQPLFQFYPVLQGATVLTALFFILTLSLTLFQPQAEPQTAAAVPQAAFSEAESSAAEAPAELSVEDSADEVATNAVEETVEETVVETVAEEVMLEESAEEEEAEEETEEEEEMAEEEAMEEEAAMDEPLDDVESDVGAAGETAPATATAVPTVATDGATAATARSSTNPTSTHRNGSPHRHSLCFTALLTHPNGRKPWLKPSASHCCRQ